MVDFEVIKNEYAKCFTDKSRIYMIENYLSTYDMSKRSDVPFRLFPRQKDFLSALRKYQNNVTTKPRQAGITTTTAAFIACEMALAMPESPETILVIGNKLDLAQQMVEKVKAFLWQIPRWFWGDEYFSPDPKSEKNKKDIFTTQNKSELILFNRCRIVAKSSGENAARGVSSVSWLIFDEAAFIENGDKVFAQAVATTSTGGHIIMISTPCGKDLLYYRTYSQAKEGVNGFHVTELKWYQDPRYNRFLKWTRKDPDSGELEVIEETTIDKDGHIPYDEKRWEEMVQKGYLPTSPWYVEMCGKFNNDEQKIAQELDVSFLGSANNVVPPEAIEMQEKLNVREPLEDFKDPYVEETWVWKQPIEGHRYILSCDPSRGDAADRTAIEVIDMDGRDEEGMPILEQVMEYQGKRNGNEIGEIVYRYGKTYNDAFIIVDCEGGTGDACILTLMRLGYKNLYYDDPQLKTFTIQRNATVLNLGSDTEKLPGFHSSSVRFQMLSGFANMIKTNAFKVRSARVIRELETWIFKGDTGRMDHMEGCHDDTLTCLAMGLFVMQFSFQKLEAVKSRDVALITSWVRGGNRAEEENKKYGQEKNVLPEKGLPLPFYTTRSFNSTKNPFGNYLWVR